MRPYQLVRDRGRAAHRELFADPGGGLEYDLKTGSSTDDHARTRTWYVRTPSENHQNVGSKAPNHNQSEIRAKSRDRRKTQYRPLKFPRSENPYCYWPSPIAPTDGDDKFAMS